MTIKLYGFGRAFGLPDPSPFVVKAEVLLKMAGLAHEYLPGDVRKAPKSKLPYIDDAGTIVADSTLIRLHIERTRSFDYDKGLSETQKGTAWAIDKMLEDHVYWLLMHERWQDKENFDRGPRNYFNAVPAPIRPIIVAMIRRKIATNLHAQGTGRYSDAERAILAKRAAASLAAFLGDKPWLMGNEPSGVDATGFAFIAGALCPLFPGPLRSSVEAHANLVAYAKRGKALWFSDLTE